MVIIGIGTDLIETARIEKACKSSAFFARCFTEEERLLIQNNYVNAAGNFTVKESVAKAFGTGFRNFELKDIEVLRDTLGKPYVNLYGKAKELSELMNVHMIHVSITNTKDYASAFVVLENKDH